MASNNASRVFSLAQIAANPPGFTSFGGRITDISGKAPTFFIWAARDPYAAPLDKVQIVKGWIENGKTMEEVQDVLCSGNRAIDSATKRCAASSAKVDLSNCGIDQSVGAAELKTLWKDESFSADQNAFYYVRAIQNPTCRWTSYDSLRLSEKPLKDVPATITEMAWSSPIWIGNAAR